MQVMALYIIGDIGRILSLKRRTEIIRYLYNSQVSIQLFFNLIRQPKGIGNSLKISIFVSVFVEPNEDGGWFEVSIWQVKARCLAQVNLNHIALRILGEGPEDGEDRVMGPWG